VRPRDALELAALGALWGASFMLTRFGAGEFGPAALAFVRVAGASLMLLPLLLARGGGPALRRNAPAIAVVGLVNSALPFLLFSAAALALGAGLMSMLNATAPIWGALLAWVWLGDRLGPARIAGLMIGVAGVAGLAWDTAGTRAGVQGLSPGLALLACVLATMLYGLGANVSRRYLTQAPALAVAAGSQLTATLVLALPALMAWPAENPRPAAWAAAAVLSLACTGLAYILYFRLIAHIGAARAMSVTFLVPAFALLWGWLALGETPTRGALAACAVILFGTALSSGLLRWPVRGRRDAPGISGSGSAAPSAVHPAASPDTGRWP
jgi:drug/metabolite transporter (DMT)-like permease